VQSGTNSFSGWPRGIVSFAKITSHNISFAAMTILWFGSNGSFLDFSVFPFCSLVRPAAAELAIDLSSPRCIARDEVPALLLLFVLSLSLKNTQALDAHDLWFLILSER
jgi:hypothetical protein